MSEELCTRSESNDIVTTLRAIADTYFRGATLERVQRDIDLGLIEEVKKRILEIVACRYRNGIIGKAHAESVYQLVGVDPKHLK